MSSTKLQLSYDNTTHKIVCRFTPHKRFSRFLAYKLPKNQRKFIQDGNYWLINIRALTRVAHYGKRCFDQVDLEEIPKSWRKNISLDDQDGLGKDGSNKIDPYSILYLLPSAPRKLVEKAYKILADIHHPDKGGDVEKFLEIKKAYDKITESNDERITA